MNTVYLSLGGNLGAVRSLIEESYLLIEKKIGEVIQKSSFYESEPWGFESDFNFINSVVKIETELNAFQLLENTQEIEVLLGRKEKTREAYVSRPIDIDIVFFNQEIIDSDNLIIPHLKYKERLFVLMPLDEITVDHLCPKEKKTVTGILAECSDKSVIKKLE